MENKDLKNFDIEKLFTRQDYSMFKKAVETREEYEFRYAKQGTYLPHPTTGIYFQIDGRKCDNGIWKDNYLYGFHTWRGNGGLGVPFDPVEEGILSYEKLINMLNNALGISAPKQKQLTFLDFEM